MESRCRGHWKWWVRQTAPVEFLDEARCVSLHDEVTTRIHATLGWGFRWGRWYWKWWVQRKPEPTLRLDGGLGGAGGIGNGGFKENPNPPYVWLSSLTK